MPNSAPNLTRILVFTRQNVQQTKPSAEYAELTAMLGDAAFYLGKARLMTFMWPFTP